MKNNTFRINIAVLKWDFTSFDCPLTCKRSGKIFVSQIEHYVMIYRYLNCFPLNKHF